MKITIEQLNLALSVLAAEMIETFPLSSQKACGGIAFHKLVKENLAKLRAAHPDGQVDMDEAREYANVAMKSCKGELSIDVKFEVMGYEVAPPRTVIIRQADVDRFFNETLPAAARTV